MTFTTADVARMRLIAQGLVEPIGDAAEVVRHLGCTQAQDYPGSTASIALRTRERTLVGVRAAYDAGTIVRSWPMRGTLFAVAAEDLGWMLGVTAAAVQRSTVKRRAELGLTDDILARSAAVAREALAGGGLVRADVLAAWAEAGLPVDAGRGYHQLFHLAVDGVICLGPTDGTQQRFVLTQEWITAPRRLEGTDAVAEWWLRYATSHGPASVAEFRWWTKLLARDVAPAVEAVRDRLTTIEVDGQELWLAPDLPDRYARLAKDAARPFLLPGFDEVVLGYGDRSYVMTREQEALVVPGRNGVFKPTLVVDGRAVGTWTKPTRKGVAVEIVAFGKAPAASVLKRLSALPS